MLLVNLIKLGLLCTCTVRITHRRRTFFIRHLQTFLYLPFFTFLTFLAHIPLHCHPECWWGHSHWCPHQPKYWWGYVPGIPGGVDAYVSDLKCASITTSNGHNLPWVNEVRHLGTYIISHRNFKCSVTQAKSPFIVPLMPSLEKSVD